MDQPIDDCEPAPPAGFVRHRRRSPLTDPWEPIYERALDGRLVLGLRLRPAHTNSRGLAHGGLIAALADKAMGSNCAEAVRRMGLDAAGLVTVSLSVDYLDGARPGQWFGVDANFVKAGRTLCFAGAEVTADGAVIARAHATFRVLSPR